MTESPTSFPRIGDIFQERYRLDQVIGQGGYARVYRAHQVDLGRDVAIKVLRTQHRTAEKSEEAARRFEREAKLVSQLRDPHTITVFDSGRTETGGLYMVTEFVDGTNLLDFVNASGPLPYERASSMVLQILYSLQEAHQRGILHRDIKPANVMVYDLPGRPNQVKLLDFGIAKAFEEGTDGSDSMDSMGVALTAQGRVVGSPGYMAPEQIRGESLGPHSDLYSLGLVLFEMLTAERAIPSEDLRAAFRQIDEVPFRLPDALDIPDDFRAIVHRMIDKDPQARYQTAEEVIEALSSYGAAPRATAERRPAHESSNAAATVASIPAENDAARRYMLLAVAALIVAAIAAGAFLFTNL